MNTTTLALSTMAALSFGLGCGATQTQAFQQMSAADHERVAIQDPGPIAAEHAEAARELREAEAAACVDVSAADRDEGPFARRDRIEGVQTLKEKRYVKGFPEPIGVAVYLRAEPGMTEQWLTRLVQCHLAHQAVVGRGALAGSPLSVPGAKVAVSATPTGFRVTITSRDPDAAKVVVTDGQALLATPANGSGVASNHL